MIGQEQWFPNGAARQDISHPERDSLIHPTTQHIGQMCQLSVLFFLRTENNYVQNDWITCYGGFFFVQIWIQVCLEIMIYQPPGLVSKFNVQKFKFPSFFFVSGCEAIKFTGPPCNWTPLVDFVLNGCGIPLPVEAKHQRRWRPVHPLFWPFLRTTIVQTFVSNHNHGWEPCQAFSKS